LFQLKDIAAAMDGLHPRNAKKWWRRLDREQERMGRPRVCPDVRGHGPHRWEPETFNRLIALWKNYYAAKGSTAAITRAKFAGESLDQLTGQINLPLQYELQKTLCKSPNSLNSSKNSPATTKLKSTKAARNGLNARRK
jgi:hypothetical protein